tara:strand:- start:91 stop:435 length:345 start_codon:yes stop_codon:yes gene_type:complete
MIEEAIGAPLGADDDNPERLGEGNLEFLIPHELDHETCALRKLVKHAHPQTPWIKVKHDPFKLLVGMLNEPDQAWATHFRARRAPPPPLHGAIVGGDHHAPILVSLVFAIFRSS